MRPDMHELLVERPRWAHGARYPRSRLRNARGDEPPTREALSRKRYGNKRLSENFAPLVRFLRSNVGRPWAKVHSEMATVLAPSNAVQRHVLEHLPDFLVTNVFERDGELWAISRYGAPELLRGRMRTRRGSFYVDPRSGLLQAIKPARVPPVNVFILSPTKQVRRVNGLWFEITLAEFPLHRPRNESFDVMIGGRVMWQAYGSYPELRDIFSSGRYIIARRQVSKRLLRRLMTA